ncbi:Shedu anti-phage system protein SduA domain-containing protein [Streptomyces virginiae]|uniref:Shedu anti-phage system protein SduA domain-containing protein n=1 Tax=Streptomyces virginiae TaxID=1961 RepID=UPI0035DEB08E
MTETDWRRVVAGLRLGMNEPSEEQKALASCLGFSFAPETPHPVAAALLRRRAAASLYLAGPRAVDDSEYEYLERVCADSGMQAPARTEVPSRDILNSWLSVAWARRSVQHLERLEPHVGDVVVIPPLRHGEENRHGVVNSISADGRLNFVGGRNRGARIHRVLQIIRPDEADHEELSRRAREELAQSDPHPERLTRAQLGVLDPFKVKRRPSAADREALREALDTASSERDMQELLEKHPSLLAGTVKGNHGTWVRRQVRLGSAYVPDFLMASETSAGVSWHLVELESPTARLTNPGNQRESPTLRTALNQIHDWREWLADNLLSARMELPGITVQSRGLIIIGREDPTDRADKIRDRHSRESRIEIRTYDWLLRAVEGEGIAILGLLDLETDDQDPVSWPS